MHLSPNEISHLTDVELNALLPRDSLSDTQFAESEFSIRMACLIHNIDRESVRASWEKP
jgi:hypothetical protein